MPSGKAVTVEIPSGELIDRITILEIKAQRVTDPEKLNNVEKELRTLTNTRDCFIQPSAELAELTSQLKAVNEALWEIEDGIRDCERAKDFGPRFVELARSVYRNNDRRAELKRKISILLGSNLIEEKSYKPYE